MRRQYRASFGDRIGRLVFLCLWLITRYSLGVWLTEPSFPSPDREPRTVGAGKRTPSNGAFVG